MEPLRKKALTELKTYELKSTKELLTRYNRAAK